MVRKGFGSKAEVFRDLSGPARIWDVSMRHSRDVELFTVPYICSPISNQAIDLAKATYEHLIDLPMADSTDGKCELRVDILVGADLYWNFVSGKIVRNEDEPVAIETVLGWVLSGKMESGVNKNSVSLMIEVDTCYTTQK